MRNIIIAFILFVSVFANAQSRIGLVHPRVLGQAADTTQFGVILLDTLTNAGEWFTLNPADFTIEGGVVGLRFQTDSVFTMGDSLCAITNGDTLCVFQDSVYITNDSFCIIQMGDTTCVEFTGGVSENVYNTSGSLTGFRTLSLNGYSLTVDYGPLLGDVIFNTPGSFPLMSIAGGTLVNNTSPMLEISSNGSGDSFMKFNGAAAEDYAFGVDKSVDALVIAEGTDVDGAGDQMMLFYSAEDSIVSAKDHQFDAGILDGGGDIGAAGEVLTSTGSGVNWEAPASGSTAISALDPATIGNTINNDAWEQEWQWDGLAGGSGLVLSSANTGAIGSGQKLLEVALSGANGISGQSTYSGYFSNTHTGTSSSNFGIRAIATSGTTNYGIYASTSGTNGTAGFFDGSNYGVYATGLTRGVWGNTPTSGAYGMYGENTHASLGTGVYGSSAGSGGVGVWGSNSNGGDGLWSRITGSSTGTNRNAAFFNNTTGTPATNFGGYLEFLAETSTTESTILGRLVYRWADVTHATRLGKVTISAQSVASHNDVVDFYGDKRTVFNGRSEQRQGADVASVAGAIALGYDGNVFEITGTNAITLISNLGFQNGTEVTLLFTSTATLTDGTANSGTDIGIELAGNTNFTGSADDVIKLTLCEIGGTQRWRESGRSIN